MHRYAADAQASGSTAHRRVARTMRHVAFCCPTCAMAHGTGDTSHWLSVRALVRLILIENGCRSKE